MAKVVKSSRFLSHCTYYSAQCPKYDRIIPLIKADIFVSFRPWEVGHKVKLSSQ